MYIQKQSKAVKCFNWYKLGFSKLDWSVAITKKIIHKISSLHIPFYNWGNFFPTGYNVKVWSVMGKGWCNSECGRGGMCQRQHQKKPLEYQWPTVTCAHWYRQTQLNVAGLVLIGSARFRRSHFKSRSLVNSYRAGAHCDLVTHDVSTLFSV